MTLIELNTKIQDFDLDSEVNKIIMQNGSESIERYTFNSTGLDLFCNNDIIFSFIMILLSGILR